MTNERVAHFQLSPSVARYYFSPYNCHCRTVKWIIFWRCVSISNFSGPSVYACREKLTIFFELNAETKNCIFVHCANHSERVNQNG